LQSPGETRRGNAEVCLCIVIASGAKQSIAPRKERMDCFAEPVVGRRFAPTRWLAMTVADADDRTEKPRRAESALGQFIKCYYATLSAIISGYRIPPTPLLIDPFCEAP
jgi:hypothetical protein